MNATQTAADDITQKLRDILQANRQVKKLEERGIPSNIIADHVTLLEYHLNTMIDNEITGQPQSKQKTGKVLKSFR